MRAIVPIHELNRRLPEQGRIRMGVKAVGRDGKPYPRKLKRFRFTSADLDALNIIATKYGGTVEPWTDAPTAGQHQVTVEAQKIPIVLPPDPMDGTPIYETWSGGGCIRRCDGLKCTLQKAAGAAPDAEPAVVDCLCREENRRTCRPKTRLNVILQEVPFAGSWRLESNGWNSAQELPGMVEMVMRVQATGLTAGYLEIQERQADQGHKKFIVPAVGLPESIEALAAGEMKLAALAQVREIRDERLRGAPELEAPKPAQVDDKDWYDDAEVVDAELVEESSGGSSGSHETSDAGDDPSGVIHRQEPEPPAVPSRHRTLSPRLRALHAGISDVVKFPEVDTDADAFRHGLALLVSKGRERSSKALDDDEQRSALDIVADLLGGQRRYVGLAEDGRLRVSQRQEEPA